MLARFTGVFQDDVEFSMPNAHFDVVFGKGCAARVARGRSVMLTVIEMREFIMKRVMPAFAGALGVDFSLAETAPT
jgi:hypothetical protein